MPPKYKLQSDLLTVRGAGVLCSRIRRYWTDRGYHGIVVERQEIFQDVMGIEPIYQVRSNIGPDGYPPRRAGGLGSIVADAAE